MKQTQVIIVGGGVAGISCARILQKRGIDFLLIECSDSLGGRVRSDTVDGYILDRGFQVFNSSYTNTLALLAEHAPEFKSFHSGALIKTDSGLYAFCDPLREPRYLFKTLCSPIGTIKDKLKMLSLRNSCFNRRPFTSATIEEELLSRGFSSAIIKQFFRPFLGGIFLEPELCTSSQAFKSVFLGFSQGLAQLPRTGMGEITHRLAIPLAHEHILLGQKVVSLKSGQVTLADGETIFAENIVLALDVDSLRTILPELALPRTKTVHCYYFDSNPIAAIKKFLTLNGSSKGQINSIAPLASVSSSYAPQGRELLSVSVLCPANTTTLPCPENIYKELIEWFPEAQPRFIDSYTIKGALPEQLGRSLFSSLNLRLPDRVHLCGDLIGMTEYCNASIENAVRSGLQRGSSLYC